jgi:hypothetical protein
MAQTIAKRLLIEMALRNFSLNEATEVMSIIEDYTHSKRESQRETEDKDYRRAHAHSVPLYRKWLIETLEKHNLNYTIEEIEKEAGV